MSRAFVKEDVEVPERSKLRRAPSGLPPGALNLMTAEGARRLRERLADWQERSPERVEDIAELQETLDSATIVETPPRTDVIVFGSRVTMRTADGRVQAWRIVGVDEAHLEPGNVSWMSPFGQALLASEPGKPVRLAVGGPPLGTVLQVS